MTCCQCEGIEDLFDKKTAAKELKEYRRDGVDDFTGLLIETLADQGIEGLTLLDIGGGVGVIQHELLEMGVDRAINVDASRAYLAAAREEAERKGLTERVDYHHGNFVDLAGDIPPADIVTLDRVICCYHDMHALVSLSSVRARRFYGLIYPRDTWWMKMVRPLMNAWFWLVRNPFRFWLHPTESVDAVVRASGLELLFQTRSAAWQMAIYRR